MEIKYTTTESIKKENLTHDIDLKNCFLKNGNKYFGHFKKTYENKTRYLTIEFDRPDGYIKWFSHYGEAFGQIAKFYEYNKSVSIISKDKFFEELDYIKNYYLDK